MKRNLSIILIMCMLFSMLTPTVPVLATASGTCGDNLTWAVDGNGTLTISGTGEMRNFSSVSEVPWSDSRGSIKSVVIEDGVTSIGDYAFWNCHSFTKIVIGSGVASIGYSAFDYCGSLTDVFYNANEKEWEKISIGDVNEPLLNAKFYFWQDIGWIIYSGNCGNNVTWTLNHEGLLTISGTGNMSSYSSYSSVPWYNYRYDIKSVNISESVTSVGDYAFYGCQNIKSIEIPENVTYIGKDAFGDCTKLTSIEIPDNITSIYDSTFSHCTNLTSVKMPENLTHIFDSAFYACKSLTSIEIPDSVGYIGDSAFYACENLTSIDIPDNVTYIGDSAFYSCGDITSAVIPDRITSIGDYVFAYCYDLKVMVIPYSVNSINTSVCYACNKLSDVYYNGTEAEWNRIDFGYDNSDLLEATIHFIQGNDKIINAGTCSTDIIWTLSESGTLVISGTGAMPDYTDNTMPWSKHQYDIRRVIVEEGVTSIGAYGFYGFKNLTSVEIPNSITYIKAYAFTDCDSLTEVYYNGFETKWNYSIIREEGNEALLNATLNFLQQESELSGIEIKKMPTKTEYEFGEEFDKSGLEVYATYKKGIGSGLTDEVIKELLRTGIGENSKYWDALYSALWTMEDARVRKEIEGYSSKVYGYEYSIRMGDAETAIKNALKNGIAEGNRFWNCAYPVISEEAGRIVKINNYNILGYDKEKSGCQIITVEFMGKTASFDVTVGPKEILIVASGECGENAKWSLDENGLLTISGNGAMQEYSSISDVPWYSARDNINKVKIESGVTTIGRNAFRFCKNIEDIQISESVTEIGRNALEDCESLVKIVIPDSVTMIAHAAFNGCSNLSEIKIGSKVKHISTEAFRGCNSLTKVTLPDSLEGIGDGAFSYCTGLKEINLGEGLKMICVGAFYDCTNLEKVYIGKGIETISAKTFVNCNKITDVYYSGTQEEWNQKVFVGGEDNESFLNAKFHYETTMAHENDCGDNLIWQIENGNLKISGTGKMYDFANTSEIPWYAFKSQINSVEIGDGITYIGNRAFRDLLITEATIPEGVTATGTSIFNSCTKLKSVTLPKSLKKIANYFLYNCYSLAEINLPYVQSVGANAFSYCANLLTVRFGEELSEINLNAFASSTKIKDVYYDGFEEDWNTDVAIASGNTTLTGATFHFNEPEAKPTIIASGKCGDTLNWSIDDSGILKISGTGKMSDFANTSEIPWYAYKTQIKSLVIEEGIEYIGSRAFRELLITEATLPEGVTETGSSIFNSCGKLKSVTLPKSLKNLANYFLYNCDSLENIDLSYVETIGSNAFATCGALYEVKFGAGLKSIGASAFILSTKITDVYYDGTEKQWNNVEIGVLNDSIYSATIYFVEEPKNPEIILSKVNGKSGETVNVDVVLKDNPGIVNLMLELGYDTRYLKLVKVTDSEILGDSVHGNNMQKLPYVLSWANDTITENITSEGVIATLTFEIAKDAPAGDYEISVSCDVENGGSFDVELKPVNFEIQNGSIELSANIIGDVNSDGSVNILDRTYFARYIARWDGYETINKYAADINCDGNVNTIDRTILARHLANWTGYENIPYRVN